MPVKGSAALGTDGNPCGIAVAASHVSEASRERQREPFQSLCRALANNERMLGTYCLTLVRTLKKAVRLGLGLSGPKTQLRLRKGHRQWPRSAPRSSFGREAIAGPVPLWARVSGTSKRSRLYGTEARKKEISAAPVQLHSATKGAAAASISSKA